MFFISSIQKPTSQTPSNIIDWWRIRVTWWYANLMPTTPQNRYYLRSCDQQSSGETSQGPEEDSGDNSLDLSDIDTHNSGASSIDSSDTESETEDQTITVNPNLNMASGFHISMTPFHGNSGENAKYWIGWFYNFADAHVFNADKRRQTMPFYLKDHALAWYNSQTDETNADQGALTTAMELRFNGSDGLDADMALLSLSQLPNERCNNFFTRILKVTLN